MASLKAVKPDTSAKTHTVKYLPRATCRHSHQRELPHDASPALRRDDTQGASPYESYTHA